MGVQRQPLDESCAEGAEEGRARVPRRVAGAAVRGSAHDGDPVRPRARMVEGVDGCDSGLGIQPGDWVGAARIAAVPGGLDGSLPAWPAVIRARAHQVELLPAVPSDVAYDPGRATRDAETKWVAKAL